jgi:prepilin-type N-terminal cleavage/methylation domain-containing protein
MRIPRAGAVSAAFTLLEVLLSLAIVGLILVALNTFVFSMSELWGRNADLRLFDKHVNAVTRFLSDMMRGATYPPAALPYSTPVAPEEIAPENGISTNLVTFELPAGSRLLNWPDVPLPEVVCSLQAREGEGLYLLWHSRLETRFSDDPPRETLITPLVAQLSYDYYDDNLKKWTNETTLRVDSSGQAEAPQRLRLRFVYRKLARETTVTVPATIAALPNF